MAEFSQSWTQTLVDDFRRFDLDDDGVITALECLKAIK
jgi:Ca2+-binding EF-hand superfamily protein